MKGRSPPVIRWLLKSLLDAVRTKPRTRGNYTHSLLKGDSHSKGYLDLWIGKRDLLKYLLQEWLPSRELSKDCRDVIANIYKNHDTLRAQIPHGQAANRSYQASWPPSATLTARLIEDVIYGDDYDVSLRYGLKLKKSCEELMELEKIAAAVEAIDEAAGLEETLPDAEALQDEEPKEDEDLAIAAVSEVHTTLFDSVLESVLDKPVPSSGLDSDMLEEFETYRKRSLALAEQVILTPDPKLPSVAASTIRAALSGKDGNDGDIQKVFACEDDGSEGAAAKRKKGGGSIMKKVVQKIGIGYTEESLSARRDQVRGFGTVEQTETVYVITGSALKVEKRNRLHFKGTTAGSWIFPVAMPPYEEQWQLPFSAKKELFGEGRVAVGGKTEGGTAKIKPRLDSDVEPVFYRYQGYEIMSELLHNLGGSKDIDLIVDLTAGVGDLACLAVERRMVYFGWAFTEFHVKALRQELQRRFMVSFAEEGHALYVPAFATLVSQIQAENAPEEEEEEKKGNKGNRKVSLRARASRSPRRKRESPRRKQNHPKRKRRRRTRVPRKAVGSGKP